MLSYNGYLASVEFDEIDQLLVGRIIGLEDGVTFHADNVLEFSSAFREAVDDYVEACEKIGKPAKPSYSG